MVDQTLAYIGNVFTGRASADQIGGPIWIAQISGAGRHHGTDRPASPGGGAVDLDRTVESVPGAAARWRSPFVLRGRGCCAGVRCRNEPRRCGFRIGLVLVLMLMVFATYNDFHAGAWLGCS